MAEDGNGGREGNTPHKRFDPALMETLQRLFGVQLSWDMAEDAPPPSTTKSRERAPAKQGRSSIKPVHAARTATPQRRPRGRPRKLSWFEERKVATFIISRRLDRRYVKNAVADAGVKFGVSRSSIFRILEKHEDGAKFMALVIFRGRRKQFRKRAETKYRIPRPDFSDWGKGPY